MYLERIIKRESIVLIISVFVVSLFIILFLYLFVFNINESNKNTKKLDLKFCSDINCNSYYENYNSIIGFDVIDGVSKIRKLNVFSNESELKNEKPYVIKINNNLNNDKNISVLLYESDEYADYYYSDYFKYLDYLNVSISSCDNTSDMKTVLFKDLTDNVLVKDISLRKDESKIMCVWTWLSSDVSNLNEDVYFISNIDFSY